MEPSISKPETAFTTSPPESYRPPCRPIPPPTISLTLKDYYTPSNHAWLTKRDLDMNTTPVVFPYQGRDLLVGSGKEGRYFLMDSKSLGGANHETPALSHPAGFQ